MKDDSAEILLQFFFCRSHHQQFGHGQECPLFDVVRPAFPLPTTASSKQRQCAQKHGLEVAVVARDLSETGEIPCHTELFKVKTVHIELQDSSEGVDW